MSEALRTGGPRADQAGIERTSLFAAGAALLATSVAVAPSGAAIQRASGPQAQAVTTRAKRAIRAGANRERAKRKIPVLKEDRSLDRAARGHARAMQKQGFFGHVDPQGRGPTERVARVSHRRWAVVGENLAAGYVNATETCARWNHAHRANMLKRGYTHIGAGYAEGPGGYHRYYVQVFGRLSR